MITSISLHHLLKAFPRRMALHGLRRTCNALASTRPWVELSHGRPSHGVISRFFFKSWHLRAIQTLWLQVCRITAVTFEFGDNIKFTGLQLGVPGNTFWETSRSEHSGTDVATIEAATLKDSRGSMNEWKSGTLLGNLFWLCWGLEKRSLQYQLHSFFFVLCFVSFLFWEFVFNLGRGRGRWQGKTSRISFLSKVQWFFKPEELYEKMNDKLPTKVPTSVPGSVSHVRKWLEMFHSWQPSKHVNMGFLFRQR